MDFISGFGLFPDLPNKGLTVGLKPGLLGSLGICGQQEEGDKEVVPSSQHLCVICLQSLG